MDAQDRDLIKRGYGIYQKGYRVNLTSDQLEFLEFVREQSGGSMADCIRWAINHWRFGFDKALRGHAPCD